MPHHAHPYRSLAIRGVISGVFMGFANLVPGISAGAVMLATGIFRLFLNAMSDLATFRPAMRSLVLLGFLGFGWVSAVLLGAGVVKGLVLEHRWIMYSVFIGLTLGGVPLVWTPVSKGERAQSPYWIGAVIGLGIMGGLGVVQMLGLGTHAGTHSAMWLLFVGGVLAAGATVLPGGSGTFVLLLMGLYVPLLGSVSGFKDALAARDLSAGIAQAWVLGPFALGMGLGLISVSLVMKWTLAKFPTATFGVLLGLLLGSVVGLWPFQEGRAPKVGDWVKGRELTTELLASVKKDDWPVRFFTPSAVEILVAIGLIVGATILTIALTRLESRLSGEPVST